MSFSIRNANTRQRANTPWRLGRSASSARTSANRPFLFVIVYFYCALTKVFISRLLSLKQMASLIFEVFNCLGVHGRKGRDSFCRSDQYLGPQSEMAFGLRHAGSSYMQSGPGRFSKFRDLQSQLRNRNRAGYHPRYGSSW